ncbi:MAG: DUF4870 domain-containing protein [Caryophanon sp.]|nr:DUF4870 domain-containing protein [Caryophanon sp.]
MEEKWTKVLLHASAFFMPLLVPVLIFLVSNDKEIKRLSIQALLFQFVMWLFIGISTVLSFIVVGIPFLIIFSLMTVIVPIIGIVKALSDDSWEYPIVKNLV